MTLLALAALVVTFVATWVTMPSRSEERVARPASFFATGIADYVPAAPTFTATDPGGNEQIIANPAHHTVDVEALERRVVAIFGGAAAVIALVGIAFGAGRRRSLGNP